MYLYNNSFHEILIFWMEMRHTQRAYTHKKLLKGYKIWKNNQNTKKLKSGRRENKNKKDPPSELRKHHAFSTAPLNM